MKKILVTGGNGFIGHHLARRLKAQGHHVTVVDIKDYEYGKVDYANKDLRGDLRDWHFVNEVLKNEFDEIFSMAADMGGCQYVFTMENDAEILHNSAQVNLNILDILSKNNFSGKIFYSSSACLYDSGKQNWYDAKPLKESDAYPANPDSDYGFEKLFSERLYSAYNRNKNIDIRIGRFHNIYGPEGTYKGGREKAPASISRKVSDASSYVEVWGDGSQRRSFLFIEDCIEAVLMLMNTSFIEPINIGSEEGVSIIDLWNMAIKISGKPLSIKNIPRPERTLGVISRNSDNTLIRKVLNWEPKYSLFAGMQKTYNWINEQVNGNK